MFDSNSKLIYMAHPYSSDNKDIMTMRYIVAMEAVANFWSRGEKVVAPIVQCHAPSEAHNLPTDHDWWLDYNRELLTKCRMLRILDLPGLSHSNGTAQELAWANSWEMPVELWDCSGLKSYQRYAEALETNGRRNADKAPDTGIDSLLGVREHNISPIR